MKKILALLLIASAAYAAKPQYVPDSYQMNSPFLGGANNSHWLKSYVYVPVYECVEDPRLVIRANIVETDSHFTYVPGVVPPPIPNYPVGTRFSAKTALPDLGLSNGEVVVKLSSGQYASETNPLHTIEPNGVEGDDRFNLL